MHSPLRYRDDTSRESLRQETPAELAARVLRAESHLAGLERVFEARGLLVELSALRTVREILAGRDR